MNAKSLSIISILLAIAAIALAIRGVNPGSDGLTQVQGEADKMRVDALTQEVAKLREEVARSSKPELGTAATVSSREVVQNRPADATWESRIAALELAVTRLEADLRLYREARASATPATSDELRAAQRLASDYRAPDKERVEALRKLRFGSLDGKRAITEDVARAMVDLAERSPDENVRIDVYRNIASTAIPLVRDSMLRALASDPSATVRRKVAQDIHQFRSESSVHTALRHAADNDVDEAVRKQAKHTLSRDDD